jgi:hypothetical protein
MGKWPVAAVSSLLWCPSSNRRASPIATTMGTLTSRTIATVRHVAHAQLLLAPTVPMGGPISMDRCYCWTRGTCAVAASAHISDGN